MIKSNFDNPYLEMGFIHADNCMIDKSDAELIAIIKKAISSALSDNYSPIYDKNKKIIRNMLRFGGFKPTGRNKPASEYIINNAINNNFPYIYNAVDINNLISLLYFLPVSTIDAGKTNKDFSIKEGKKDEEYIFNQSGQIIDIEGLITVYDGTVPIANPIKDSQLTKLSEDTKEIAVFIYSSKDLYSTSQLSDIIIFYEDLLKKFLNARIIESNIIAL